jgi:Metal-dependent hydrolase
MDIKKELQIKSIFHAVMLLFNVLFFLALVMATFADRISPEKGVIFAYSSLLFPLFFLANISFLLFWIIRLKKYLVLSLLGVLLSFPQFLVYFPMHKAHKELPAKTLKILSYNVRGFNYVTHTEEAPNPTIKYILEQNADIICIQEFGWSKNDGYLDRKGILKAFKGYPYYRFTITVDSRWNFSGLACFSKYPIISSYKIPYKSKYNASAYYCIKIGDRKLDVINNHLESNKFTGDDISTYKKVIKDVSSENIERFNDIIIQKMDQAYKTRAKQARLVREAIDNCEHDVIVCGDFNDGPLSYAYHKVKGDLKDAFVETGFGPGISYNENYFYFRIDHILHSPSLKAYNCKIDRIKLSDHFPISCYFEWE